MERWIAYNDSSMLKKQNFLHQRVKKCQKCQASYTQVRRTVCEPNARMYGWDGKHALRRLRTIRIPSATNQTLSVHCTNTKRTGCARYPFLGSGSRKINKPCTQSELLIRLRFARVYNTLQFTSIQLATSNQCCFPNFLKIVEDFKKTPKNYHKF